MVLVASWPGSLTISPRWPRASVITSRPTSRRLRTSWPSFQASARFSRCRAPRGRLPDILSFARRARNRRTTKRPRRRRDVRQAHIRRILHLERFSALLTDPSALLADVYGFGAPPPETSFCCSGRLHECCSYFSVTQVALVSRPSRRRPRSPRPRLRHQREARPGPPELRFVLFRGVPAVAGDQPAEAGVTVITPPLIQPDPWASRSRRMCVGALAAESQSGKLDRGSSKSPVTPTSGEG